MWSRFRCHFVGSLDGFRSAMLGELHSRFCFGCSAAPAHQCIFMWKMLQPWSAALSGASEQPLLGEATQNWEHLCYEPLGNHFRPYLSTRTPWTLLLETSDTSLSFVRGGCIIFKEPWSLQFSCWHWWVIKSQPDRHCVGVSVCVVIFLKAK